MATPTCPDNPPTLLEQPICLSALSKDLKGALALHVSDPHTCKEPGCTTLKTAHGLKLEVHAHAPCDSHAGQILNGTLEVGRLISAFEQDGNHRGLHAGDFVWTGAGVKAAGRMSGITNAGPHREPPFKPCQTCDSRGVLEGRLCGSILEAKDPALVGVQILGIYLLRFDPSAKGGEGAVSGTFEGTLVRPCKP